MQRRTEIDALRGLMLVWMTLTHLPTVISTFVNQPFGFVSSSEGFIFLSALFTGYIYYRVAERDGYGIMRHKLWARTLRLYGYHILLLLFAFVVAARVAIHGNRPGLHNLLDFYFVAGPARAMVDGALLIYRPPLLDILPIYIIFLLTAPVALTMAARMGWKSVLCTSFGLWFLGQLGMRQTAYAFMTHNFSLHIPLNAMGAFDLWAWQLVWVLGLWCGVRWEKNDLPREKLIQQITIPAATVSLGLVILRYAPFRDDVLQHFGFLFDKWHLGIVRLFDFAAIATLLLRFQRSARLLAVRPLVLLGQASLQVFCAHLLFCFLGLAIMGDAARVSGWKQVALVSATILGLLLTAKIFAKPQKKGETRHVPQTAVVPGPRARTQAIPRRHPSWLPPVWERPQRSVSRR